QGAAKRSRLFPPAALVTSPVESFSRVVGSTLGLRIPDRRVHDVLEQLIALGHVPIRIGELARFDDELAPLAVRVLRRRRARVEGAVAVELQQNPVSARVLLRAVHGDERANVFRPRRRSLSEAFVVFDRPLLVGFLLPDLDGVPELLDELHASVLLLPPARKMAIIR